MKIYRLHILALAALLLAACEPPGWDDERGYIRFSPTGLSVEESGSRAPIEAIDGSFGVLGYCLANYGNTTDLDNNTGDAHWEEKYTRSRPHIFYKKEVGANGVYTNAVKWLNSRYHYTFFAYYPYNANISVTSGESTLGAPTMSLTMPNTTNPAEIPDAMVATAIDATELIGNVQLHFRHLLSGIQVRVRNYDSPSLVINSATLSGTFIKSANITFNTDGTFNTTTSGTQNVTYNLASGVDVSTVAPSARVEDLGIPVMLLGNSTTKLGSNLTLTVNYTHQGTNTVSKSQSFTIEFPADFSPQAGTIYTFELQFINNAMTLSLMLQNNEPWQEDEGNKDITFE